MGSAGRLHGAATISRRLGAPVLTRPRRCRRCREEAAHGERVAAASARAIADAAAGCRFREFMEAALYAPGLGYYMTRPRPIFGADGDFITAPELSPLFTRCLAAGVADLLAKAGRRRRRRVRRRQRPRWRSSSCANARAARAPAAPLSHRRAEPGARRAPARAARRSPAARGHCATASSGSTAPPPEAWQGVALANEVVDALPVDRFRVTRGTAAKRSASIAARRRIRLARAARRRGARGGRASRCKRALPVADAGGLRVGAAARPARLARGGAAQRLTRGAMLVDRLRAAARAVLPSVARRRHAVRVPPAPARRGRARDPGLQDLTAWVDYSALADDGAACGLEIGGLRDAGALPAVAGIERELARLAEGRERTRARRRTRQAAATLLLPGEMGERFKVDGARARNPRVRSRIRFQGPAASL